MGGRGGFGGGGGGQRGVFLPPPRRGGGLPLPQAGDADAGDGGAAAGSGPFEDVCDRRQDLRHRDGAPRRRHRAPRAPRLGPRDGRPGGGAPSLRGRRPPGGRARDSRSAGVEATAGYGTMNRTGWQEEVRSQLAETAAVQQLVAG